MNELAGDLTRDSADLSDQARKVQEQGQVMGNTIAQMAGARSASAASANTANIDRRVPQTARERNLSPVQEREIRKIVQKINANTQAKLDIDKKKKDFILEDVHEIPAPANSNADTVTQPAQSELPSQNAEAAAPSKPTSTQLQ